MLFNPALPAKLSISLRDAARRWRKCRAGSFAVEFGLISPILMMLFVVAFDVSVAMYNKIEMESAAKTAVQYGLLRKPAQGNMGAIEQAAQNDLPAEWFADGAADPATVTASLNCLCPGTGSIACTQTCPGGEFRQTYLSVQIAKTHRTLFNYPLLAQSYALTAASTIRLQ
jgi:Flp pilus assembly protein TadG